MRYNRVASGRLRYSGQAERPYTIFFRDRSGNVAIVFALMAVILMLAIGAAVDFGRWLHARDQTIDEPSTTGTSCGRTLVGDQ